MRLKNQLHSADQCISDGNVLHSKVLIMITGPKKNIFRQQSVVLHVHVLYTCPYESIISYISHHTTNHLKQVE